MSVINKELEYVVIVDGFVYRGFQDNDVVVIEREIWKLFEEFIKV